MSKPCSNGHSRNRAERPGGHVGPERPRVQRPAASRLAPIAHTSTNSRDSRESLRPDWAESQAEAERQGFGQGVRYESRCRRQERHKCRFFSDLRRLVRCRFLPLILDLEAWLWNSPRNSPPRSATFEATTTSLAQKALRLNRQPPKLGCHSLLTLNPAEVRPRRLDENTRYTRSHGPRSNRLRTPLLMELVDAWNESHEEH